MIGIYDYTVIATYLALAVSALGIFRAEDDPATAVLCLLVSGVIDTFDGRIARTKKNRTFEAQRFGIQIDSLNDLVCFGVLPALICRALGMTGPLYSALLIAYMLSALIRLAYFNVLEERRQDETAEARRYYLGLPVTTVSVALPLCYILSHYLSLPITGVLTALMALLAIMFISPIHVAKLGRARIAAAGVVVAAEIVVLVVRFI